MPDFDDISDEEMEFTKNHQIIERPCEPAAEHDYESPDDRTWQFHSLVQEPHAWWILPVMRPEVSIIERSH